MSSEWMIVPDPDPDPDPDLSLSTLEFDDGDLREYRPALPLCLVQPIIHSSTGATPTWPSTSFPTGAAASQWRMVECTSS